MEEIYRVIYKFMLKRRIFCKSRTWRNLALYCYREAHRAEWLQKIIESYDPEQTKRWEAFFKNWRYQNLKTHCYLMAHKPKKKTKG